jgi:ElaB/YqjD/DUF883 family membrane-anchored ribosome-binding protein
MNKAIIYDTKFNGNSVDNKNEESEVSIKEFSHQTGKRLGTMTNNFTHSANEYVKSGREYVAENPAKGVAMAAATGAVVGSIITWAMSKRH